MSGGPKRALACASCIGERWHFLFASASERCWACGQPAERLAPFVTAGCEVDADGRTAAWIDPDLGIVYRVYILDDEGNVIDEKTLVERLGEE